MFIEHDVKLVLFAVCLQWQTYRTTWNTLRTDRVGLFFCFSVSYVCWFVYVREIHSNEHSANMLFSSWLSVRLSVRHGQCTYPSAPARLARVKDQLLRKLRRGR